MTKRNSIKTVKVKGITLVKGKLHTIEEEGQYDKAPATIKFELPLDEFIRRLQGSSMVNYTGYITKEYDAEEFGADNCEGKKLKDSGYCNLNFGWSSSGLSRSCQNCGNEEFMDDYWDSQRISMSEPEEGKILCSMNEFNGGRDENDLGYCSFDFNYGSGGAFSECDVCGTEVMATFDNSFYEWDDDDDDEFDAQYMSEDFGAEEYKHCDGCEEVRSIDEFSLSNDPKQTLTEGEVCDYCFGDFYDAEGINLRKRIEDLIDLREINFTGFKKDTKREAAKRARRMVNEIKGVIPKRKSYKVDKPKWFKMAQTGIVMGVAGLVGYKGFKGKE